MDPVSLAVLGSLVAAFPMALMAAKGLPSAAVSAAAPALEGRLQLLRKQQWEEDLGRKAHKILAILTTPATQSEDDWADGQFGAPHCDWALMAAVAVRATGGTPPVASAIKAEQVWPLGPDMKALVTGGEEQLLSALLKTDTVLYGVALRRVMQQTETRGRSLGLAP